ncbi:MAG: SDR family oxidoreductase [bacterium]
MLLQGKNAIITGCNRGIGKAILAAFAENGANVWACARKPDAGFENYAGELAKNNNVQIQPVYFDLADAEGIRAAVKTVRAAKKPVDALVNNAGISYNALFQMSSMEMLRETFEVNFFSMFMFTQYISKLMAAQKSGSIINIASSAGIDGNPGRAAYGASKAAVICMTKTIAAELGVHGVRANSIAPGITKTEMISNMTDEVIAKTIEQTHIQRAGRPSEIANTAVFLASGLSSHITGQVIRVDGGLR